MDVVKELVTILGGTVAAVAAVAWLARSLATHLLSKDLERHKAALQAQSVLELEKLRAELTRRTLEHEVRFRRVDEKVAEVLAELYRRLLRLYEAVSKYVKIVELSSEPSKEEKLKIVTEANDEFWESLLPNRVYVPPKLYGRVQSIARKLGDIADEMTHALERDRRGTSGCDDGWLEAYHAVEKEVSPLFKEIVQEVQKRLGVEDTEDQDSPKQLDIEGNVEP